KLHKGNPSPDYLPRYAVICDFRNFVLKDLTTGQIFRFTLAELPKHVHRFDFLLEAASERQDANKGPVNADATDLVTALYTEIEASGYENEQLALLNTRLVFCMFAGRTAIFEKHGQFLRFLQSTTDENLGMKLSQLFQVLDRE